ncbi:MAG: four helix bundle protein [Vicinamibacterales bacterium]
MKVYQKALDAADAVSAILKRPCFQRDFKLREQLADSSDAVPSLIADGFPQSTDRFFAQMLYRSRGESAETRTHLRVAKGREYVTESEMKELCDWYNEIEKMLTGLIRHLEKEDRRHRG